MSYPKPVSQRAGGKVAWLTFATDAEAKTAAAIAERDAARLAAQGYDFGACQPGTVRKVPDGWEVCIP